MKTTGQRHKSTTASTKGKAASGVTCTKSGISSIKAAKQRRKKTVGNTLISIELGQSKKLKTSITSSPRSVDALPYESPLVTGGENNREFSGQPLPSSIQPLQPAFVPRESLQCFQKFKLQLFPIDEDTRKSLEMDKHNPYLELTLGTQKKISSVVKHLSVKWGNSKMASGELMLFPYSARLENLASQRRWTLKDSNTSVADVHAVIGSPAIFRLRYGWLSNLGPKICGISSISLHLQDKLQDEGNQKKNVTEEKIPCLVVGEEHELKPDGDSLNQNVAEPMNKSVQAVDKDNVQSEGSASCIWADLSNISFGALLSEASAKTDVNDCRPMPVQKHSSLPQVPVSCDSFDAAIAHYKAMNQSAPVAQSSIWDAEETCSAFSFQKITSSAHNVAAESQDVPNRSCAQNVSSNPLRLHDALVNACQEPESILQLHTNGNACQQPTVDTQPQTVDNAIEEPKSQIHTEAFQNGSNQFGKLDIYWPESLGPLEYAAPSSRQIVGGESIGLGGLIASSLDAFQNFSIF